MHAPSTKQQQQQQQSAFTEFWELHTAVVGDTPREALPSAARGLQTSRRSSNFVYLIHSLTARVVDVVIILREGRESDTYSLASG